MRYYKITTKIRHISLWQYVLGGVVVLLCLYGFNSWMTQTETTALKKTLVYTEEEYQTKLTEVAYDKETNLGKNRFILNRDFYLARLEGYKSYQGQKDFRNYYTYELLQLANYDASVYHLGLGAQGDVGKGIYQGDYVAGKKVLNKVLGEQTLPPQSTRYGTSNWMFPVAVLNHLSSFYGIFLIILLFGFPYLFKYENNQIKLFLTQPISRTKMLLTDSFLVLTRFVMVVVGGLGFSFLIGSLFGETIPHDYPILVNNGDLSTMPLYQYLMSTSLLLILSVFLIYLTTQLFVILTRNSLISLVLSLLLVFYGQGIFYSNNETVQKVAPYVAALYLTPQKVYTGLDYQVQCELQMEETDDVPGDYLKGRETEFSLWARADFSEGNIPASRSRFLWHIFMGRTVIIMQVKAFNGKLVPT